ncbi:cation:proton antiporter [Candidatus Ichthyocystis hellenicum]|uniref:cation:proton antiporter n=1 Tax=Candidatus Ichthyocystis hellenicum TaxID=1561003 RepID=UPI0015850384|nr:cation:proton antiporter [Candidatus Ichthyocystis hellenicum]
MDDSALHRGLFVATESLFHLNNLILFGVLLVSGIFLASCVSRAKLPVPRITSFMVAGFLIGPEVWKILTPDLLRTSKDFVNIALALILFRLGQQIDFEVFKRNPSLIATAVFDAILTFLVIFFAFQWLHYSEIHSAIVASVAISSSPAILILLVNELGVSGRFTSISLDLVAANNVASALVFSLVLPFLHYEHHANWTFIVSQPIYSFILPILVAYIMSRALYFLSDFIGNQNTDQYSLMAAAIVFSLGISKALNMSMIMLLLSLGIFTKNYSSSADEVITEARYGKIGDIFYIILFVVAGAKIEISHVAEAFFDIVVFTIVRFASKFFTLLLFHRKNQITVAESFYLSLIMVPMAGLAIGLIYTTQGLYPEFSDILVPVVFGSVAVLEGIGPILTEVAFLRLGEIPKGNSIEH